MQGNIINPFSGSSSGFKVNGIVRTYIAGSNIKKGKFVKLVGNEVQKITNSDDTIRGLTETSAENGQDIKIIVPDFPPYTTISHTLNTGESGNYGFKLINGYYVSQNAGVASSYSKCRIAIKTNVPITLTITSNSYSETNFDYGIIGNLDTPLEASSTADSSYKEKVQSSSDTSYTTTTFDIEGDEIQHFIEFKYIKDGSQDKNNDNFKFKYSYVQRV